MYELRKIADGESRSHYLEGMQKVELIRDGQDVHQVEIVRANDISPAVWSIERRDKEGVAKKGALQARTREGYLRKLVFTDYVTASELTHWIKAHPVGTKLGDMGFDNLKGEALVPQKNLTNECLGPSITETASAKLP